MTSLRSNRKYPVARVQNQCLQAQTLSIKIQTAKPQDNCPRSLTSKAFLPLRFLITIYLYAIVLKKDTACLNTPTIPYNKIKSSEEIRMKRQSG